MDGSPGSCQEATPAYAVGYTYDADGNAGTVTRHFGQTSSNGVAAGVTQNWYDGADRLVEVQQPKDSHDVYGFAWMTRYIYDLSHHQTLALDGASFYAYGNLYKTQECLAGTNVAIPEAAAGSAPAGPLVSGACTFQDVRGNSFDGLDRSLAKYEIAVGTAPENTSAYDGNGQYGLLSQKTTATGQSDALAYDAAGRLSSETFSDGTPNRSYVYDGDGRATSLTSTTTGTQTRSYNADGTLASSTTPSALPGSGTITYAYYPDGLRKDLSLTIPSLSVSKPNLMAYNYRADGLRSSLVSSAGSGGTFAWSYTNAGRELTQSDPFTDTSVPNYKPGSITLAPRTFTYDAYGRIATEQLPASSVPSGQTNYDAEGELLYFTPLQPGQEPYSYSTRGELGGPFSTIGYYANGTTCQTLPSGNQTTPSNTGSCTYDARSGALASTVYDIQATENGNPITEHMGHVYGYDTAGRETSDQSTYGTTVATSQRSYDADNHVTQQTVPVNYVSINPTFSEDSPPTNQYAQTNAYVWAADGQPAQRINTLVDNGTFTTTLTYGWDGNTLLYQYDGSSLSYYIEKLGTTDTTGKLTVFDRDYSDTAVQSHNTTGFSARNDDPSQRSCETKLCQKYNPNGGSPSYQSYMPPLTAVRTDGYSDGLNVFQGVRAYDPNSAQWTAPDAYAGDVRDPMSQKPYMWNRNNPLEYEDPSGYLPIMLAPEMIKALESALKVVAYIATMEMRPTEGDFLQRIGSGAGNTIRDHLTESDLSAAAKEIQTGEKTAVEGRRFDHVEEVKQAVTGLENRIQRLDTYMKDNPNMTPSAKAVAKDMRDALQKVVNHAKKEITSRPQ